MITVDVLTDGCEQIADGKSTKCNMAFNPGDTIKVRVDERKCSISFAINNMKFMKLAQIKKSESPYYFAVSTGWKKNKFTLTKYQVNEGANVVEAKETEQEVCMYASQKKHRTDVCDG